MKAIFPAPLNEQSRPAIFKTSIGGHDVLTFEGQSALIKVTAYNVPEVNEGAEAEIASIQAKLETEAADEAFLVYLHGLSEKYPAKINERLLQSVYGQQDDEN